MYFGEPISSFKDLMSQRRNFTFSTDGLDALDGEWWDKHASEINGHRFVAVGFTDYGGCEIDNLVYRKAKEIDKNGGAATYEEVWNGGRGYGNPYVMGGNAIIFGEIADKMCEGKDGIYKMYAPLGDLDNDMTELQVEFINKNIDYISKDKDVGTLSKEDRDFLYDWLNDHGRMQATDIDFSYADMWDALEEFRGKPKVDPRQMELDLESVNEGVKELTDYVKGRLNGKENLLKKVKDAAGITQGKMSTADKEKAIDYLYDYFKLDDVAAEMGVKVDKDKIKDNLFNIIKDEQGLQGELDTMTDKLKESDDTKDANGDEAKTVTLELTYDDVKRLAVFTYEAVVFGDERADEWENKFNSMLDTFRK